MRTDWASPLPADTVQLLTEEMTRLDTADDVAATGAALLDNNETSAKVTTKYGRR